MTSKLLSVHLALRSNYALFFDLDTFKGGEDLPKKKKKNKPWVVDDGLFKRLASFHSSLDPLIALQVYRDLSLANHKIVIGDDLPMIFQISDLVEQITPIPTGVWPNWSVFLQKMNTVNDMRRNVIEMLGLNEGFWMSIERNKPDLQTITKKIWQRHTNKAKEWHTANKSNQSTLSVSSKDKAHQLLKCDGLMNVEKDTLTFEDRVQIAERLYASLILYDLAIEKPISAIAYDFNVERDCFITIFFFKGGYYNSFFFFFFFFFFFERMKFGVNKKERKLKPLFAIGNVMTRMIASVLVENGIKNVVTLAQKSPDHIQKILMDSKPFQTKDEQKYDRHKINPRLGITLVELAKQKAEIELKKLEQKKEKKEANKKEVISVLSGSLNPIVRSRFSSTTDGSLFSPSPSKEASRQKPTAQQLEGFHYPKSQQAALSCLVTDWSLSAVQSRHESLVGPHPVSHSGNANFVQITPSQLFSPKVAKKERKRMDNKVIADRSKLARIGHCEEDANGNEKSNDFDIVCDVLRKEKEAQQTLKALTDSIRLSCSGTLLRDKRTPAFDNVTISNDMRSDNERKRMAYDCTKEQAQSGSISTSMSSSKTTLTKEMDTTLVRFFVLFCYDKKKKKHIQAYKLKSTYQTPNSPLLRNDNASEEYVTIPPFKKRKVMCPIESNSVKRPALPDLDLPPLNNSLSYCQASPKECDLETLPYTHNWSAHKCNHETKHNQLTGSNFLIAFFQTLKVTPQKSEIASEHAENKEDEQKTGDKRCTIKQQVIDDMQTLDWMDSNIESLLWEQKVPKSVVQMEKPVWILPIVIDVFVNEQTYQDFVQLWHKQKVCHQQKVICYSYYQFSLLLLQYATYNYVGICVFILGKA
ncbi:hypothetical protein RFI_12924 [Reticulomyxa filosa]|uniref:POLQ-like helical domain-containing protein n=1 Tax=Reticulomyxa filosa TaxID=46433 RepID=X6ND28_RETFI|nr:hypothetical protein RFI_12924 [Reticulomyxa filosa]|eukprot:ETO24235.1 hypothetical protein RFI_12924 [Reticulomyxa filosa]